MICPRCGLDNQPGLTACARCGLPAARRAAPGQAPAAPSASPAAPSPRPDPSSGSTAEADTDKPRWWDSDSSDDGEPPAEPSTDAAPDEETTLINRGQALGDRGQSAPAGSAAPHPAAPQRRNLRCVSSRTGAAGAIPGRAADGATSAA